MASNTRSSMAPAITRPPRRFASGGGDSREYRPVSAYLRELIRSALDPIQQENPRRNR